MLSSTSTKIFNITSSNDSSSLKGGIADILESLVQWRMWSSLAVSDIRSRYKRTVLGPFWVTFSLAIFMFSTSILFSKLWNINITTFIPFYASGFIFWTFIANIITESSTVFVSAEGLLKFIVLPYFNLPCQLITRNLLVLCHHMVVYLFILIFFKVPFNFNILLVFPALILTCLTGMWVSVVIGFLSARYRDIQQFIQSFLQISLFLTPIFWPASHLENTGASILLDVNPFNHFINLLRMPLLGQTPEFSNWIVAILITFFGWLFMIYFFSINHRKLIFWL